MTNNQKQKLNVGQTVEKLRRQPGTIKFQTAARGFPSLVACFSLT